MVAVSDREPPGRSSGRRVRGSPAAAERPKGDLVRAVSRALAVLDVLANYPGGTTPKAIAAELGLNVSTVYHLLNTLVAAEHAIRAPDSRLFFLGPRVAHLHAALVHSLQVPPRLRDMVDVLRHATGDTANLCQWWGDEVLVSVLLDGTRDDRISGGYVGIICPGQFTATGKVLLAWQPAPRVEAYLTRGHLGPFEHLADAELPDVRTELAGIRRAGYAVDRDPVGDSVCCIAAPVVGADGRVQHALGIATPAYRFRETEATLVETVLGIARAASAVLQADTAGDSAPSRRVGTAPILPRIG
jgi:DNA-binding IclR family transcriptional regulator